jgi:hypothetical protein
MVANLFKKLLNIISLDLQTICKFQQMFVIDFYLFANLSLEVLQLHIKFFITFHSLEMFIKCFLQLFECVIGDNLIQSFCPIMPVHGLIHDGQLRACPCVVLGLMYGLRRLYAIRYLGF